jgi:hypothetical protein
MEFISRNPVQHNLTPQKKRSKTPKSQKVSKSRPPRNTGKTSPEMSFQSLSPSQFSPSSIEEPPIEKKYHSKRRSSVKQKHPIMNAPQPIFPNLPSTSTISPEDIVI